MVVAAGNVIHPHTLLHKECTAVLQVEFCSRGTADSALLSESSSRDGERMGFLIYMLVRTYKMQKILL